MTQLTPDTDAAPEPAEMDLCAVCGEPSVATMALNCTDPTGPADQHVKQRHVPLCEEHLAEFKGLGGQKFFDRHLSKGG